MQLEEYFDFETHETRFGPVQRIRLRGHRISIEHVVQFFKEGFSPETISREIYPSLSLEKVYASITYYLHNKESIEEYIRHCDEIDDKFYQDYLTQPESGVMKRLRAVKAARQQHLTQPAPPSVAVASEAAHP